MKRKCKCGQVHNFTPFKHFKTTFGGTTTHYEVFCRKLGQLMILTTTTFPSKLTWALCFHTALKKYSKVSTLMDSNTFHNSGLYCLGKINITGEKQ